MAVKSVYLPEPSIVSGIIQIKDEEHRHLTVARAEPGELLEVFDGKGSVWTATVVEVGKRQTWAKIESRRQVDPPGVQVILGQSLIRTSAFELAIEKAVEVGVTRIVPFVAARSNTAATDRRERWMRIVVEAAKQSKRYRLPVLDAPLKFDEMLGLAAASRIMLTERNGASLKSTPLESPVLFLVGPEGGWTDPELEAARAAGFAEVSLGSGILRSETAAMIGAALIRYELGSRESNRLN